MSIYAAEDKNSRARFGKSYYPTAVVGNNRANRGGGSTGIKNIHGACGVVDAACCQDAIVNR